MIASAFRSAARRSALPPAGPSHISGPAARRQLTTSAPARADAVESTKQAAASAQSQFSQAADKAKQLGGPYAARAQGIFSSISESVLYNARVVGALAKQVYVAERLAPPTSTETILSAYKSIWAFVSNPAAWSRLVQNGDWKKVGIYSVEALGIFTIGEMIGRRSIVGYSLNTKHHGHGHH